MSRKFSQFALYALLIAAMLLSACAPAATPTEAPAPAATEAAAPAATEAPAQPETKLAVGIVLPTKDEPRWIQDETRFKDALTAAGYDVEILFSQGSSAKEKENVEALLTKGIKVLIICPQDGTAAAAAADAAKAAGVKVISYDRLIRDTDAVDYYVTFDSIAVGAQQAQYLVDNAEGTGNPLYLYAGASSDNNAFIFFEGAWGVLQPKIADGTFVIKNSTEAEGLKDKATLTRDEMAKILGQVTTNWDFNTAKNLAEANLTATKAEDKGKVFILAPNDGTARAIADAFGADTDVTQYFVTGQDAEKASVQYIVDGKQSMTVFKDVRTLVQDAIAAAVALLKDEAPAAKGSYNNGKIDVPAIQSPVVSVDQKNVVAALIDSGYYAATDFTGLDTMGQAPAEPPAAEAPAAGELAGPAGGFLEKALAGEYKGTTVVVDGPFTSPDTERFEESMKAFEDATGIDVKYIGDKQFESRISIAVDAGTAPDIADFPQPGQVLRFVEQGKIVDPSTFIPEEWLKQQYNQSWLDMGMIGGQMGGVWHRFNGKSLVWYPKKAFDEAGYAIPTTWDEMLALTDQIKADGDAPWCVGIESQAATGWPATDWMEEIMLRTTTLENYDKWITGELPFNSPEVKAAAEKLGELWFTDGNVFGGREAIVSTFFGDAPAPMFENPPKCWLHKQGNFITGFFPPEAKAGEDYDFFYLPAIDEQYGKPFLVAGDIMSMFNDRPEVRALMEYFTLPQSASGWLTNGGALAAHQTATPEMYGVDLERGIAALVSQATSFRFDGSDLMPAAVGSGSFWKGMTDWVSGAADLDTVLNEITNTWPK